MRKFIGIICFLILLPTLAFAGWHQITLTEWKDHKGGGKRGYPKNERVFDGWIEKGGVLLVNGDVDQKDLSKVRAVAITDEDADKIKKDVFGIFESGVTK